jgi:hypothetical protein
MRWVWYVACIHSRVKDVYVELLYESLTERDKSNDLDVYGRVVLKSFLKEWINLAQVPGTCQQVF